MPLSKSPAAYSDIASLFDRAMSAPRGVAITLESPGKAKNFAQRANYFRTLDRQRNAEIYPDQTHPMHRRSMYDCLEVRAIDSEVTIKPISLEILEVKEL